MNTRDLQYLLAVGKYKHFGRAAEACNVSQPALSMQIKKLEEGLGVLIFERVNKEIIITPTGRQILALSKEITAKFHKIKEVAKAAKDPCAGDFKLGAFPSLAPYLFPSLVPKIAENMPLLRLLLVEEKTAILVEKLRHGELDAAFLAVPFSGEESGVFKIESLFIDKFKLAVSKRHILAKQDNITRDDIPRDELLLLEEGHCLRDQALSLCEINGNNDKEFRGTSLETLRQMVIAGVGVTLIPEIAVPKNYDEQAIEYLDFIDNAFSRRIALVYRKNYAREEVCERIKKIVARV